MPNTPSLFRVMPQHGLVVQRLDRAHLDFGRVLHTGCEERELHIINTGRVAFPFKVVLDQVCRDVILRITQLWVFRVAKSIATTVVSSLFIDTIG